MIAKPQPSSILQMWCHMWEVFRDGKMLWKYAHNNQEMFTQSVPSFWFNKWESVENMHWSSTLPKTWILAISIYLKLFTREFLNTQEMVKVHHSQVKDSHEMEVP
jgi:hypothetical protein